MHIVLFKSQLLHHTFNIIVLTHDAIDAALLRSRDKSMGLRPDPRLGGGAWRPASGCGSKAVMQGIAVCLASCTAYFLDQDCCINSM